MRHEITVFIIGKITDDVKTKSIDTQNGPRLISAARVEVEESYGQKKTKSTFNIKAWGAEAQALSKMSKGDEIIGKGKLVNESYTDQQGNKKWSTNVTLYAMARASSAQQPQVDTSYSQEYANEDIPF